MDLGAALDTTVEIAREAGQLLIAGFGQQKIVDLKSSDIDLVTQYDRDAEALITERIATHFPGHRLMGEEGGDIGGDSPYIWYVDPIDGTTNFAHGMPYFCVSLALYANETPLLGVVLSPIHGELFAAVAGRGATMTDRDGQVFPLRVTNTAKLAQGLVATGFPYDRRTSELDNVAQVRTFVKEVQGLRRLGSAALDICYVAAGRLDGYWEYKLNIWDVAAGALIVQEAGGRVSLLDSGEPYRARRKLSLLASNPLLHDEMMRLLSTFNNDHSTDVVADSK